MIRTEVTLTQTGNNAQSRYTTYDCVKRLIDLLVATTALLLLAPLMAVLAAVVKLTSPGPVFFTHVRLGRDGIEFHCYKFRTMVADAETVLARSPELQALFDVNFKLERDPRLTSVGAFLRRTSLDELPQFYNVLNGTMTDWPQADRAPGAGQIRFRHRQVALGQARPGRHLTSLRPQQHHLRSAYRARHVLHRQPQPAPGPQTHTTDRTDGGTRPRHLLGDTLCES